MITLKNNESELDFVREITDAYRLTAGNREPNLSYIDRYGKDGSEEIGSGTLKPRNLTIEFDLAKKEPIEYTNILRRLSCFFEYRKRPFYVINQKTNKRTLVSTPKMRDRSGGENFYRISSGSSLEFRMLEGSWEDVDVTETSVTLANRETLTIHNQGDEALYPIFELTAVAPNELFSLVNETTGAVLTVGTSGFTSGVKVTIDNQNGLIQLISPSGSQDVTGSLADSTGFIFAQTGVNQVRYDSIYGHGLI